MIKVRVIEVEGDGEAVKLCVDLFSGKTSAPAPVVDIPSQPERITEAPKRTRQASIIAPAAEPEDTPGIRAGSIAERVYDALKRKPMSSIELCAALNMEPAQVYAPCKTLKDKGLIESFADDSDGTRWYKIA